MGKLSRRAKIVVAASAVLVTIGGGVAFAYWSSSGSGSGTAATTTGASDLAITQASAPGDLAPGVAPEAISGTIKNNGTSNAFVHNLVVSIGSVTQAAGATGTCDATDYILTGGTVAIGQDLTPGQTVTFNSPTLAFNDKTSANQDGCKGATVDLAYSTN
jgi:hypothetical protein